LYKNNQNCTFSISWITIVKMKTLKLFGICFVTLLVQVGIYTLLCQMKIAVLNIMGFDSNTSSWLTSCIHSIGAIQIIRDCINKNIFPYQVQSITVEEEHKTLAIKQKICVRQTFNILKQRFSTQITPRPVFFYHL
jgi:hypothetical protein